MKTKFSAFFAMSVDGYIAGPGDSLDWLACVHREGEDYGYAATMAEVDMLVMGRRTYDIVRGFDAWPYGDTPVVVMSKRPAVARYGERFFPGTPRDLADMCRADRVERVLVDGGSLIRAFLDDKLLTSLTVSVVPRILGGGVSIGSCSASFETLEVTSCETYESGLMQLRCRVPE